MKEDIYRLYGDTEPALRMSKALQIQTVSDDTMENIALNFAPNNPDRQAFRRAVRWAREQTTEEVVKALTPP